MKVIPKLTSSLAALGVSLAIIGSGTSFAAGSASFSLTPGSAGEVNGSTFGVAVYESSSDAVNVVTANLTYDQSKLQFIGIDASGSGFDSNASSNGGSGSVSISRFVSGGGTVTGSQKVATVDFKALVGSGSTSVNFSSSSVIASNGSNVWNGVNNAGTYYLIMPVSTPPSGGTGGSTGSTSTGSTGSSTKASTSTGSTNSTASTKTTTTSSSNNGTVQGASTGSNGSSSQQPTNSSSNTGSKHHSSGSSHHTASRLTAHTSSTPYWVGAGIVAVIVLAGVLFRKKVRALLGRKTAKKAVDKPAPIVTRPTKKQPAKAASVAKKPATSKPAKAQQRSHKK